MHSATANTPMIAPRSVIVTRATLSFPTELRHFAREIDGARHTLTLATYWQGCFQVSLGLQESFYLAQSAAAWTNPENRQRFAAPHWHSWPRQRLDSQVV